MTAPSYFVGIEFASGSYTNITDDVLQFSTNRSLAGLFHKLSPGDAQVELFNQSGKYSPDIPRKYSKISITNLGRHISTPDSVAASLTGPYILIMACIAPADWTNGSKTVVGKLSGVADNSFALQLTAAGGLQLIASTDGTSLSYATSTTHGFADGAIRWVVGIIDVAASEGHFYTSADDPDLDPSEVTLSVLEENVAFTASISGGIYDSGAAVAVGDSGLTSGIVGDVYRAVIIDSNDSTDNPVVDLDPKQATEDLSGNDTLTSGGAVWTLESSGVTLTHGNEMSLPYAGLMRPNLGMKITATHGNALITTGAASDAASTPDAPSNSILSDIDIRFFVAATDWTPTNYMDIVAKWGGSQNAYLLRLNSGGTLQLYLSNDGTSLSSATSDVLGFVDGVAGRCRVTWNQSAGEVKFYTTSDNGLTWDQFGAPKPLSLGGIFDSSASVKVAARNTGVSSFDGETYLVQIYRGIDGTLAVSFDPNDWSNGDGASFDSGGVTWTLAGNASISESVAVEYPIFKGVIDEWNVRPGLADPRKTVISARDSIKDLRVRTITTSLFVDYNVGSLFNNVLTAANVTSAQIDALKDQSPFTWFRDRKADSAIQELLEAGFFFCYAGGDGIINVKDRYFDVTGTVVASYDELFDMTFAKTDDDVINKARIQANPRQLSTSLRTVAQLVNPITIPASGYASFFLEYLDPDNQEPAPAQEMVTPVSSTDYLAFTNSDGSGTDVTSALTVSTGFFGQTSVNTIFNGGGTDAWLTKFNLRGKPIQRRSGITAEANASSSQAIYGDKTFTLSNDFIDDLGFATSYTTFLLERNQNPIAKVGAVFRNEFPESLQMELGSLVHITNSITGVASTHIIQQLSHDVDLTRGTMHQTTLGLELRREQSVLILDDSDFGKLDERKLGL